MERKAVRNLRLCTKDCLCLYVCPTGASDTEDSVIDVDRCKKRQNIGSIIGNMPQASVRNFHEVLINTTPEHIKQRIEKAVYI